MIERRVITVEGIVQGVGFRPFVFRTARALGLNGRVRNAVSGVEIDLEGAPSALDRLARDIAEAPPSAARVHRVSVRRSAPVGRADLSIDASGLDGFRSSFTLVGPDLATCGDCLSEALEPADRRHGYAFHSCTECGPRYSIIRSLPYDRSATSMAEFQLCGACSGEYDDPDDRRFHAQPVACPECGPSLRYREAGTDDDTLSEPVTNPLEALRDAVEAIRSGRVVVIKGLGGYHMACDATRSAAVRRLRRAKSRDAKPLALMVRDVDQARELCFIEEGAERLLTATARPIVLLPVRPDAPVASEVAPGLGELGVMLPYTPLHHLLTRELGRPLVLTSGNASGSPMVHSREDAARLLEPMVDGVLDHDREIVAPCDDSVIRWLLDGPSMIRRSRGFAPEPLALTAHRFRRSTLALGGHLKNTFCLGRDGLALLSPHVGDLESFRGVEALRRVLRHHLDLFDFEPEVVAHDLHPGYATTLLARELELPTVAVQHHHAHVAACMAEHGVSGPVLGIAFDGAGLGDDDAIWGGEALLVDRDGYRRVGHLGYVPLPGGDAAARQPWRMAASHLHAAFGADPGAWPVNPLPEPETWTLLRPMLERGLGSPDTSSVGRLFDAVAAILGIRAVSRYEGQAAMELESRADPEAPRRYAFDLASVDGSLILDPRPVVASVAHDAAAGRAPARIAGAFHRALADAVCGIAGRVRDDHGVEAVALTGGVFQNGTLTRLCVQGLREAGLHALVHRQVPCNDGGLSLGQAVVAGERPPCA